MGPGAVRPGPCAPSSWPGANGRMVRSKYERALVWDTPLRKVIEWMTPSPPALDDMEYDSEQDQSSLNSIVHIKASEAFPKKHHKPDDPNLSAPFPLLSAEYVEFIGKTTDGVITLSNYRLFIQVKLNFFSVALGLVDLIECRDIFFLYVHCKDARTIRCTFANNEHCQEWYKRLLAATAPPKKLDDVFAFAQYAWLSEDPKEELRLTFATETFCPTFDAEVQRMGFDLNIAWRISDKNKEYSLCSSYPQQILVPKSIKDEDLANVASFRSSQRIPAVVWRHQGNGSVIARCSQPEVGWLGWRNSNDENLIQAIALSCAYNGNNLVHDDGDAGSFAQAISSTDSSVDESKNFLRKVLIVDARSYAAAVANRAKGGGCECPEYYPNCEIQFMSLANIHSIRRSFQSVRGLCAVHTEQQNWYSLLESTKWLQHISGLLKSALIVVNAIDREARPVLVHCSDGWDRTPQIVALAELMLDPYYRTINGFQVLVEREWLEFGHKFGDRCGHGLQADDTNERCPVFLQWLDCVHQLQQQYDICFEFNGSFLVKLAQHVYSCLFGTFMCNSSQERRQHRVQERTYSVWAFLQNNDKLYRNYLYKEVDQVIRPSCQVRDLELWSEVYRQTSDSAEEPTVCPDSSSTSTPPECEEADGIDRVPNGMSCSGGGGSPLVKTRSYADLVSAVEHASGRQRRSSDPSVVDGSRELEAGSKLDDESEEDDEVGHSKLANGGETASRGLFGGGPKAVGLANGHVDDEDEDSVDETLAERVATACHPSREGGGRVRRPSESDSEEPAAPPGGHSSSSHSESRHPTAIESSTDTLVGELTPDTKVPVSSPESEQCPLPNGNCEVSDAFAEKCGNSRAPLALVPECCDGGTDAGGLHASTSTSDISDSHVAIPESASSALYHRLSQSHLLHHHHPPPTNGHVNPSMSWNGPNLHEHQSNGHGVQPQQRWAGSEYPYGAPRCACTNGNGHRRPVEVNMDSLKQLNSYGRLYSTISTPPHSRTPSSGFPATPSDDRSSDVTLQRGMSTIGRKLDSDGLPLMNAKAQQRLHEIMLAHQEAVLRLENRVFMAQLALCQQVCQKCNGHSRRTTEHSDEVGSLPDSLGNGEQHSLGQESTAASDVSWEQVDEQETRPTLWVPDHAVNRCTGCDNEFCMVRRKHHCRSCGRIFCAECSSQMIPIPSEQLYHPVRVCATCFELLHYQQIINDSQFPKPVASPASN